MNSSLQNLAYWGAIIIGPSLASLHAQEPAPLLIPQEVEAPNPEEVVARVGGVEITRAEHVKEFNRLVPVNYFHSRVPSGRQRELQKQATESLIEKTLIHLDALQRGMKLTEEEIRQRFMETLSLVGSQYENIEEREFQVLLASYRPLVERKLLIEKNEARFGASLEPITEELLRARFQELDGQLMTEETVRFLHILLKVDPSASAPEAHGTFRKLEEIKALIDGGQAFEDMAREHSSDIFAQLGGDMGFVTRSSFVTPGLSDRAFELIDGQTSEVLNSIYGYHLLRRVESKPRRPLTFEEARQQLEEVLIAEQNARRRAEWLASLKESFSVEVLIDFEPVEPPAQDS